MHRLFVAVAIFTIALLSPEWAAAASQDDQQVAQQIRDSLKNSGQLSGYSITVKYQQGTAWLEGRVSSEEQKTVAVDLTGQMPEVSRVIDHLRVEAKPAGPVVRLLTRQSSETEAAPKADELAAPEDAETAPVDLPFAGAPDADVRSASGELVFPEALDEPQTQEVVVPEFTAPAATESPTVRQATNQRSVLRRLKPAASEPSPMSQVTLSPSRRVVSSVVPAATPRPVVSPVATRKTVRRQTAQTARQPIPLQASTPTGQVGQVRMVPMLQLADGRLVPLSQGQMAAQGASEIQPVAAKTMPTSRRRAFGRRTSSKHKTVSHAAQIDPGVEPLPLEAVPVAPASGGPLPAYVPGVAAGVAPAYYDQPHM
ncbi:MAG TPA: BON domain-containing protein, partial [Pirellulales bacterium]|nr:BON domain-containing protein [Pirellulales bacterium]